MTIEITGHQFWRADNDDALYSAAGAIFCAGSLDFSNEVGYEVDGTNKYQFNRRF